MKQKQFVGSTKGDVLGHGSNQMISKSCPHYRSQWRSLPKGRCFVKEKYSDQEIISIRTQLNDLERNQRQARYTSKHDIEAFFQNRNRKYIADDFKSEFDRITKRFRAERFMRRPVKMYKNQLLAMALSYQTLTNVNGSCAIEWADNCRAVVFPGNTIDKERRPFKFFVEDCDGQEWHGTLENLTDGTIICEDLSRIL